jgi:hypothetical protein
MAVVVVRFRVFHPRLSLLLNTLRESYLPNPLERDGQHRVFVAIPFLRIRGASCHALVSYRVSSRRILRGGGHGIGVGRLTLKLPFVHRDGHTTLHAELDRWTLSERASFRRGATGCVLRLIRVFGVLKEVEFHERVT